MARIAQGKGVHAVPVITKGLTDQVWAKSGELSQVDGCYFQVIGGVEKVKGVRNLVDWDPKELHLLNTRINAIASYRSRNGPEELVVSLSGLSSKAIGIFNHAIASEMLDGLETVEKYRGGRILVLRNDRLEHPDLPHIAEGSAWDPVYSEDKSGTQLIAKGRVEPEDQFGGDHFATWAGWLFVVNGTDENIKWNGSYAAIVGVHERPTPPRTRKLSSTRFHPDYSIGDEFSGAGDGDRGNLMNEEQTFQYRCTFVSKSGAEGPPSEPGNGVITGRVYRNATYDEVTKTWYTKKRPNAVAPNGDYLAVEDLSFKFDSEDLLSLNPHRAIVEISGFERPTQPDIVWRNIYKRAKDGGYYFWRQVAANERICFDYERVLDSSEMGSPLQEGLAPPPTSKYVAFFRGRGYYVPTEFPSFVFYSDPGLPEQMSSALQYLDVNSVDGSVVTGLYAFGDSLVVFKENSIWQVTSLADGSPVLTPIDESIGSLSPRAMTVAYERLIFLGAQGVYQFDGATIKPLSESLNAWWKNVYVGGLGTATSWLDERERRLFISLQSGPDDVNDLVVCYHYQLDAITLTRGQRITASTRYKGETILGVQHERVEDPARAKAPKLLDQSTGQQVTPDPGVRNSDLVIWGLGDSFSYSFSAGGGNDRKKPYTTETVGSSAGRVRFGPYSANQTGWNSSELMEVAGIDLFFPYAGTHELTIRWFKDRNPVAAGWGEISGTEPKKWGTSTWNGDQQLLQRVTFPETLLCREIEIEFQNAEKNQPFVIDGFVIWRISKGAEAQR